MYRILLVDDNIFFRESLKEMIKYHFPNVHIKESSGKSDILTAISLFHPNLLVLDVKTVSSDVLNLLRKVENVYPGLTILAFLNFDSQEYRKALTEAGVYHLLPKDTFTGREFLAQINELITKHENIRYFSNNKNSVEKLPERKDPTQEHPMKK